MEIQDILKLIMEERCCSPIYALYIYVNMQNQLKNESEVSQ